jgi:hypothetical protein
MISVNNQKNITEITFYIPSIGNSFLFIIIQVHTLNKNVCSGLTAHLHVIGHVALNTLLGEYVFIK